jgi:DNA-binding NarL/FixJ family response regulator
MLLEREGLDIAGEATTAAEGHRLARALQPDVVLADIVLGADSGFELARRLADDPLTVGTTVVLISTHSAADFAELIEASPAAGFLPKVELSARALQNLCGHGAP